MKETIKKGVQAGVGLVDLSIEMARAAIDTLVKTGELTGDQGKKAIAKLQERGAKDIEQLKARLNEVIGSVAAPSAQDRQFATQAQLEALSTRVAELERIIGGPAGRKGSAE